MGDCLNALKEKHEGQDHSDMALIGLVQYQRVDTCLVLHYLQDALLMQQWLVGKGGNCLNVSAMLVYI